MRTLGSLVSMLAAASFLISACGQTTPEPTKAPAASTKAAEPTKALAPAAAPTVSATTAPTQPTAVPAKKVDFPVKGKPIMFIVAFAAGGATDVHARLLAAEMEKELQTPVQVVNRVGGGAQVGTTELALAKPDGYTIGLTTQPTTSMLYLDPERKATFGRKDLQPIAIQATDPAAIAVKADDKRFQTVKDLVDAAKRAPESIKIADAGFMVASHLAVIMLEKAAGARFASVHFDSSPQGDAALLGGNVDANTNFLGNFPPGLKAGQIRLLGVMGDKESAFVPGVKTLADQGYPVKLAVERGISAPGGTPKEIVDILAATIKKASENNEFKRKLTEQYVSVSYVGPEQYAAQWNDLDTKLKPLLEELRKK